MPSTTHESTLIHIGWGSADITPEAPAQLAGQHFARVSERVRDPVTATALALSSGQDISGALILISCDMVSIADELRDAVRARITAALPELAPASVILNATHSHTAPLARVARAFQGSGGGSPAVREIELPALAAADYIVWAADRIAAAAVSAWRNRAPGAIGYGLGQAVVGRNRRSTFAGGVSRMYGNTATADFSHIEGYEDHGVNLLATWNADGSLTGLVVNLACPALATGSLFEISADYWHETRVELRRRLGDGLYVLPQCSAAGDQSPHIQWDKGAEERMLRLAGRTPRQEIAARITAAVDAVLPAIAAERHAAPVLAHRVEILQLPRRRLTEADVREALADAEPHRIEYERLLRDLGAHPEQRDQPRWYVPITQAFRKWRWSANVQERFELEQREPCVAVETHVVRLGDVAITSNPFELYLDFGIRIKARSPAVQTFIVQLAGPGSYVPSERSVAAKGYGSVPASTVIGPEGGCQMIEWILTTIQELWI